jgi:hypothetical protein
MGCFLLVGVILLAGLRMVRVLLDLLPDMVLYLAEGYRRNWQGLRAGVDLAVHQVNECLAIGLFLRAVFLILEIIDQITGSLMGGRYAPKHLWFLGEVPSSRAS